MMICKVDFEGLCPELFHPNNCIARWEDDGGMTEDPLWKMRQPEDMGGPDLRPVFSDLHEATVRVPLPPVEVKRAPPVFRRWTPDTRWCAATRTFPSRPLRRTC